MDGRHLRNKLFTSLARMLGQHTQHDVAISAREPLADMVDRDGNVRDEPAFAVQSRGSIKCVDDRHRRCSAVSVESDDSTLLAVLTNTKPNHAALAEFNVKHRSSWVNFSDDRHSGIFHHHRVSLLWDSLNQSHRFAWLDIDKDDKNECDHDDASGHDLGQHRRVRFCSPADNTVYDTIAKSDMTKAEMIACWYDEYDHEDIQIDVIETVCAMRSDEGKHLLHSDNICARGLEHVICEKTQEKRERTKRSVVEAVLKAQEAQKREECAHDSEAIAAASMAISKLSRESATIKGENDAASARLLRPRGRLTPAAA